MSKKINLIKIKISLLVIGLLFIFAPILIFAQSQETPINDLSEEDYSLVELSDEIGEDNLTDFQNKEFVAQKQRLAHEIEDLKLQLLARLSDYERDEKLYRIAIEQYRNLQTLSSIEEAITVTKRTMLARNKVLDIYQNLLRLQLIESEGVELSHKRQALIQLEQNREQLAKFETLIEQAQDRDDVNALAIEFTPLGQEIQEASYYALSIMAIGRLQSTFDLIIVVNQRVVASHKENPDEVHAAKNQRSLNEINKLLEEMPSMFHTAWTRVDESADARRGTNYAGLYNRLSRDIMPIYTNLSRIITYLEEIEQVR